MNNQLFGSSFAQVFLQRRSGSFRQLGVPYFGVFIIRILLFRVLDEGPLFSEIPKYCLESCGHLWSYLEDCGHMCTSRAESTSRSRQSLVIIYIHYSNIMVIA